MGEGRVQSERYPSLETSDLRSTTKLVPVLALILPSSRRMSSAS